MTGFSSCNPLAAIFRITPTSPFFGTASAYRKVGMSLPRFSTRSELFYRRIQNGGMDGTRTLSTHGNYEQLSSENMAAVARRWLVVHILSDSQMRKKPPAPSTEFSVEKVWVRKVPAAKLYLVVLIISTLSQASSVRRKYHVVMRARSVQTQYTPLLPPSSLRVTSLPLALSPSLSSVVSSRSKPSALPPAVLPQRIFFFRHFRWLWLTAWMLLGSSLAAEQVLTKASEVRALSVKDAESSMTARLRGQVVFMEPGGVIVQDETSTTFFRPDPALGKTLRIGNIVEVEGLTRMGLFLPGLGRSTYSVVGHAALPPGAPVNYGDLLSGRYHYQRISVEGIVRSVELHHNSRSLLKLDVGSRLLEVRVETEPERDVSLVDARVRISGVAAGSINERRQLVQPYVWVTDWSDLAILEPATVLDQVPFASAGEVLAFRAQGVGRHRIRIQGVVTAAFAKGDTFLQQGEHAFSVRFRSAPVLQVGDRTELVGFPEMDRYSASIVEAELLHNGRGAPPAPLEVGKLDDLTGSHDAHLVTVTAMVRDAYRMASGIVVHLQGDRRSVEARLPEGALMPEPRSRVRLTAVCVVEAASRGRNLMVSTADVLSLRVREPGDLQVLQNPSWWTVRRLVILLALLSGVVVLAALWIALLRWQVREKTRALSGRIEAEAALEERQRIAREFHDSLQQDLTGLGLRLDAAATQALDDKGRRIIQVSRGLLTRIQAETRNFVSDLRDPAGHDGDLVGSLESIVTALRTEEIELRLEFLAHPPPMPAGIVHHLRMMVRESVSNAMRHARPSVVRIQVNPEANLAIRIIDDGRGFDPAQVTYGQAGHFGCIGLRERAQKIGADIHWHSAPGAGTTVQIAFGSTSPLVADQRPSDSAAGVGSSPASCHPQPSPSSS